MKIRKVFLCVVFAFIMHTLLMDGLEVKAVVATNKKSVKDVIAKTKKRKKAETKEKKSRKDSGKSEKKLKKKLKAKSKNKKKKSKLNVIKTKEDFNKVLSEHLNNFDNKFKIYIDKAAIKFEEVFDIVNENFDYRDIKPYIESDDSAIFTKSEFVYKKIKKNGKKIKTRKATQNYTVFTADFTYTISKEEFQKVKDNIAHTDEEFDEQFTTHIENIDKKFIIDLGREICPILTADNIDKYIKKIENSIEFSILLNGSGINYTYFACGTYIRLQVEYETEITKQDMETYRTFVEKWVAYNLSSNLSDEEKVRKIYEYIILNYDYSFGDNGEEWFNASEENSHNARLGKYSVYSPLAMLFAKGGVCDANAKLFYALAKEADINVIYITGLAGEMNKMGPHAWNMVEIDGKWYHLDSTWGRILLDGAKMVSWDYYLKSNDTMRDYLHLHTWEKENYPEATEDYYPRF